MARKSETANSLPPSPANEEQVIAFLETHPDFLLHHPDLVGKLSVPSRFDGGPVVDMQQFVIGRLNQELDQMRGCAEHLISTSRSNMSTQARTHEAVLAILEAGSMDGLARVVSEDLPALLDVDVVSLGFLVGQNEKLLSPGFLPLPSGLVERMMGASEVLLRANTPGDIAIFGAAAGLVSSFALVRFSPKPYPIGLMALGSRNERAFHSSQGSELLLFLARILEDCVRRWWTASRA